MALGVVLLDCLWQFWAGSANGEISGLGEEDERVDIFVIASVMFVQGVKSSVENESLRERKILT